MHKLEYKADFCKVSLIIRIVLYIYIYIYIYVVACFGADAIIIHNNTCPVS